MVSVILAVLLLFPYLVSPATNPSKASIINVNERIHATILPTAWYSPSGRFAFGFFPHGDGFLVGICILGDAKNVNTHNIMVWTANRDHSPVSSNATIELTPSGKLVLTADHGETVLIADPAEQVASAAMHDSGNFVLYGENSSSIWETFSFPTDTILGGQKLTAGNQLLSKASADNFSTGKFRLTMQSDGNLVAYPSNINAEAVDAYWSTQTTEFFSSRPEYGYQQNKFDYLQLDNVGRLKLEEQSNSSIFKQLNGNYSGDNQTIFRATLDLDGILRVYSNTSTDPLWAALNDTCVVKGFCGFNSYCTLNDPQPTCDCLPGTEQVSNSQNCHRNSTKQKCRDGKSDASFYHIATMQNLGWDEDPYFNAPMSEADCKKSCLEDCNCDAAVYDSNNICNKHKFPLRYASRDRHYNATSFFKVGTKGIEISDNSTGNVQKPVFVTRKKTWVLILVITLSLVMYSCVALATSALFIFKTRVIEYKRLLENGTLGLANELTLRLYSYNELKEATKGFKEQLGKGSFGAVYKGTVKNGDKLVVIAVKRLQKLVEEGEREFQSEMRVIGKTYHKNLVKLLGYCAEGSNRLLVYEYMSSGSLAGLLFQSEKRPDWHERVRIALDVARGILYLHEECKSPIIHCDIKPQNILMDEFWTAKISDFGLSKLLMPDQTRTDTDERGTRGYVAPEWQKKMPISLKVDVYSYGIVLLEIICCRRNIDLSVSMPEEIQLASWAYSCFAAGELGKLVGSEEVDKKSLERMVTVAIWCIQADPIRRPSMKGVVLMLEGFTNISTPPCPTD